MEPGLQVDPSLRTSQLNGTPHQHWISSAQLQLRLPYDRLRRQLSPFGRIYPRPRLRHSSLHRIHPCIRRQFPPLGGIHSHHRLRLRYTTSQIRPLDHLHRLQRHIIMNLGLVTESPGRHRQMSHSTPRSPSGRLPGARKGRDSLSQSSSTAKPSP